MTNAASKKSELIAAGFKPGMGGKTPCYGFGFNFGTTGLNEAMAKALAEKHGGRAIKPEFDVPAWEYHWDVVVV